MSWGMFGYYDPEPAESPEAAKVRKWIREAEDAAKKTGATVTPFMFGCTVSAQITKQHRATISRTYDSARHSTGSPFAEMVHGLADAFQMARLR